jgi:hypothetical protein
MVVRCLMRFMGGSWFSQLTTSEPVIEGWIAQK